MRRAAALLRLQGSTTSTSTTSTTSCARRAPTSTSRKRTETADLRGRVALLTGGRVKIGYQAGIKLLRAGAQLIVTTRFPRDAARRYAREPDFDEWGDRLEIFGLDLRHTPSVEAFCRHLVATRDRLDFIINNACQTVRRPPEFYAHMMRASRPRARRERTMPGATTVRAARLGESRDGRCAGRRSASRARRAVAGARCSRASSPARRDLFPEGRLDQDLQQVDLRDRNSWRLLLAEVPTVELLEVQLVNAVAPFVLNARLKPLMLRTPERDKHIVNVSAMEGQFYRRFKTDRHPHTNMAKAALNMMTRTSAADYHADGIHMNSVDTGWVTDEDPAHIADAQDRRARLPSAARHRRRRGAHRRSDHRRLQHRRARVGPVPEGLPADRLVNVGSRNSIVAPRSWQDPDLRSGSPSEKAAGDGRIHPRVQAGRTEHDPRLPPGQYDTGRDWPVLTAEVDAQARHRGVDVHGRGTGRAADARGRGTRSTRCRRRRTRATSTA